MYGVLDSSKKRTKLTILSTEGAQDSEFRSFFGRIENTINCFWDLLTFSWTKLITEPNADQSKFMPYKEVAFKQSQKFKIMDFTVLD